MVLSSQRGFCFNNQFATEYWVKNPSGIALNHEYRPQTVVSIDWYSIILQLFNSP
jgi:hypothetical protein